MLLIMFQRFFQDFFHHLRKRSLTFVTGEFAKTENLK